MQLIKTRRALLAFVLLIVGCIYLIVHFCFPANHKVDPGTKVASANVYVFPGIEGPELKTVIKQKELTSWRKYHIDDPSAMAILLTDTESHWLGLVHGLTGIGIPFTITTNTSEAIAHKIVMVYPLVSGKVLSKADLQAVAAVPRNGGTLIAINVYGGGFNEVFAYDDIVLSQYRKKVILDTVTRQLNLSNIFSDPINHEIILSGSPNSGSGALATVGYTNAKKALIRFDDSTACLAYKDYGVGSAYAFGLDIGNYFLRNFDGRGFDPGRGYVNTYEAGTDIFLRVIKEIFLAGNPEAITISPTPFNKPFTLIITHDIDFTKSIVNAAQYAEMEKNNSIKATYFIQTKYIKDWNDDIFFKKENINYLQQVFNDSMEIGSHTVAHSRVFSKFPEGTGEEIYPSYVPFVKSRFEANNGTVLGELRVSKFLLENFTRKQAVKSFRPGHLQYPFSLPQSLEATGYTNSSSMTAGNVQTFLPYKTMYNSEFEAELDIVEVPVSIEDEAGLPLLQRFDSTVWLSKKLSKYGGVMNILIHTDVLGQKFEYEQKVISYFKNSAWITTIGEYCDWWRLRANVAITVKTEHSKHLITLSSPGAKLKGLTLHVPVKWKLQAANNNVKQYGSAVIINEFDKELTLSFQH